MNAPLSLIPIQRALISVYQKDGLIELAHALVERKIEIISTGGSAELLRSHNIPVIEVANYTGFPEIMGGRVKTLHPKIHAGILGRRGIDDQLMKEEEIPSIDLVIINLYPFQQIIANPDTDLRTAIEYIDVGGPTMIRAAAKNNAAVSVIVDPADYSHLIAELNTYDGQVSQARRFEWAKKAFAHTAHYDAAIANYLSTLNEEGIPEGFPDYLTVQFTKKQSLRYGENPQQNAAFYVEARPQEGSIATAEQMQGKELSFNNLMDADAALECVKTLPADQPACVIVKHANPCGAAAGSNLLEAYHRAYETDSVSSFGGIIAFNQTLTADCAATLLEQQFVEVVIAPDCEKIVPSLFQKKPNVRLLLTGQWPQHSLTRLDFKRVNSGLLVQEFNAMTDDQSQFKVVTECKPTDQQWQDLLFAWQVVKHVKSNAIVFAKDQATVGIGAGQMSRVDSVRIAQLKAQNCPRALQGSVMASDAFFPFRDGVDLAVQAGIKAIIQPGGSLRDNDVIAAANEAGIAMIFTGQRHFRH